MRERIDGNAGTHVEGVSRRRILVLERKLRAGWMALRRRRRLSRRKRREELSDDCAEPVFVRLPGTVFVREQSIRFGTRLASGTRRYGEPGNWAFFR